MKKKLLIIFATVIILVTAAYLYLRYSILKSPDYKPEKSASKSMLDLRPQLIAKLQQLVKDGSKGLYNLSIEQIEPDVMQSKLEVVRAVLTPDSAALARLDNLEAAPDNVFKISFNALLIDGIGINDLLSSKNINLQSVIIDSPVIEVYRNKRPYNKEKRAANDSATLYQNLTKSISSIAVNSIIIKEGTFINHSLSEKNKKNKVTRYNHVNIRMNDVLVDSSTQYDKSRFLFAKETNISIQNYLTRTSDSLYFLKCNSINISAATQTLSAKDIELIPRGSKQQFQKKLIGRQDMFTIKVPKLILTGIDWWSFANEDKLIAKQADVYNCMFKDFLDRTLPPKKFKINNYPHQSLMKLKMPVLIKNVRLHNMNLTYEELNPNSGKAGTLYFDDINGQIINFTNIAGEIKKNKVLSFKVKTKFMHKVPANITFNFNLSKTKAGEFSAAVNAGAMDTSILNPLAEPLGLFNLKNGNVKKVVVNMHGDNFKVNGDFLLLYNDLYIIPLKKDEDSKGRLKKKKFAGMLANFLLIKNSNPDKSGKVRKYTYVVQRERHPNFFNQLWKTILAGLIKTIGAPEKFAK